MTPVSTTELHPIVRRFVQEAGSTTQSFGIGRVVGQIYAYLYFSQEPRCLDDMQRALGISKGSASMGVRQLEQWNAVKKIWIKGDRKDYYEATIWLGRILKNAMADTIGTRMARYNAVFDDTEQALSQLPSPNGREKFIHGRMQHLRKFYGRAHAVWSSPIVRRLLG